MVVMAVCYFSDFELDEKNQWVWRLTTDKRGGTPISITESTTYARIYNELQNEQNVDPPQYDMELRFQFKDDSSIPIPPMRLLVMKKWIIHLNWTKCTGLLFGWL